MWRSGVAAGGEEVGDEDDKAAASMLPAMEAMDPPRFCRG